MSSSSWYYPDESSYVIGDRMPVSLLNPNQFYKICPEPKGKKDDPICGDGSPFCFYFSKPSQKNANRDKLLVELMGGGACWDANTCDQQQDMLYVNDSLDEILGKSCQEVQYGMQTDGSESNMLCANQLGSDRSESDAYVDFTQYNSIVVPYCTQDVHIGSKTMVYYENDENNNNNDDQGNGYYRTVHHTGGNNLNSVVKWIYKNFSDLRHASVTGCSAGGTAVPILQQLLHKHYNHFGNRATQVTALSDSPVYLTPSYFLEHSLGNWNPQPMLSSVGIPYEKYKSSEDYPTLVWDYILRKGSNKNKWGFVSHTDDPVSVTYYEYMSGNEDGDGNDDDYYDDNYNNNDDNNNYDNDDNYEDVNDQWYSELTSSLTYIEKRHKNVKSYWIDSEGHCTFGLYYALQEDSFSSFAASVFSQDALVTSATPAVKGFLVAAWTGTLLLALLVVHRIRRQSTLEISVVDDEIANELAAANAAAKTNNKNNSSLSALGSLEKHADGLWSPSVASASTLATKRSRSLGRMIKAILVSMEDCPVTAGYTLWITVYFVAMVLSQGFVHPINNPALGPSAVGLSAFGINNPSLIVYKHQWFRMFTSNFLVSGILTLFLAYFYLWHRISMLEERMIRDFKSPWLFVTIIIVVATIINAAYCLVPQRRGASTAAIPLLIGLQAFHLTFYWNSFVRPYLSIAAIAFDTIVVVTLFPFNSWVMIAAALGIGWITAKGARTMDVWLPGPMMNILKQSGISLELGSIAGDASAIGPAAFGTALSFPPCQAASESEYNNFDGNLSNSYETMDDQRSDDQTRSRRGKFVKRVIYCGCFAIFVLFLVPLFLSLVATPNEAYLEPFRTGCRSFYTVDIDDLSASTFLSSGDDDNNNDNGNAQDNNRALGSVASQPPPIRFFRWLAGDENNNNERGYGCAEFCVPHLAVPFVKGVLKKKEIPIDRGRCSDHGYATHVLDKTFTALSYSLDVELYASSNDDDEK